MPTRAQPRIGLLGCGLWGGNILRDLQSLGASVLVADVDAGARERALLAGADAAVADPAQLPAVDGLVVATPATTHMHSIAAIADRAVPILCEKPLATSSAAVDAIASLLRSPLHVMDVWRYHPAIERMQAIVAGAELGEVHGLGSVRANWTSPRVDVDTAWNLVPHEISIYLQVFGTYPEPVSALAERVDGRACSVWSRWSERPWMVSEVSNRHASRRRELRLHCAGGVALFDGNAPAHIEVASGAANDRLEAADRRRLPLGAGSALQRQLADWLGFLDGGSAPRSDLQHAARVTALVEKLRSLAGLDA